MPSPLRRSGSGLLQIPWPGLLSSPKSAGLDPLGPSRGVLSTRQSSRSLRPAASLLLASTPGSRPTPEVDFPAPLAACGGGTHTRRSIGPLQGTPLFELSRRIRSKCAGTAEGYLLCANTYRDISLALECEPVLADEIAEVLRHVI